MNFDEWIKTSAVNGQDQEQAMREAWDAAVATEREECAKACERHGIEPAIIRVMSITDSPRKVAADDCAAIIRARSNAKVSGGGAFPPSA